jgi:hypothetical protein
MVKTASIPAANHENDMYDIGDEIRELNSLSNDELLVQGEFYTKKKQLLVR